MPGQQYAATFVVEIGGRPIPEDVRALLVAAYVDDSRNVPDLAVLRFRDPDRVVVGKAGARIGAPVRVSVAAPDRGAPTPLITAEVTALEVEIDSTGTFTVVRALDHSHRLFRGRSTETYQQMTAADVARKVAGRAGLRIGTIEPTSVVLEHVSQGNVTDWAFLQGLAAAEGYEVAVADGSFSFRRPTRSSAAPAPSQRPEPEPFVLRHGVDLLRLHAVVTSAEQVKEVQVRGWDVAQKRALVGTAPAATESARTAVTPADLARAFGDRTYVATDVPYRSQPQVDAAAGAIAEQIAGAHAELEGVARGNPALRAGVAVALANLGEPFDGTYTLTTTRHSVDANTGYTTSFRVTGRQERSLYGLTAGGVPSAQVTGVVPAQVTNTADPQRQGRVKLRYPWLSDSYESDWARTVHAGAGAGRGALFLPEVNDEVLVAFEQGDLNRPYVVGGLHNGVDAPPSGPTDVVDPGSGAVNRRALVSRTGHRLELLEAPGGPDGVQLVSGDGALRLELDQQGSKVVLHSDGTVVVEARQGVTVDAGAGAIALSGRSISLTASQGVSVDGGATCSIQAAMVTIN